MSCIGTAGHIDHGKSALVEALTGIDPDRLAEEKKRGMTIDLGFAWLTLPSGREVSIIDVPGHEGFIKNMLAGVGGIDAALLIIAADEGIMPQTREHLAILDLLCVQRGVVALTKADLVDDEWIELVQEEVEQLLRPTSLAGAKIIPISSYTKRGIPELLAQLDVVLEAEQRRQDTGRARLPIDRVFTLTGFGTIVTGTLLDGAFRVGQEVEVQPQGIKSRVRGLQTHKRTIDVARPGNRVAINLANIARVDLARGNVVALPGQAHATTLLDVRIRVLNDLEKPLPHNALVDFYCGAQEMSAKVRLLDVDELAAGKSAWAQLLLNQPAVVARRDRFILRLPSPAATIGGGEIVDIAPRYHRRHQSVVLESLEHLAQDSPEELVMAILEQRVTTRPSLQSVSARVRFPEYELKDIARQGNLAEDVTRQTLESLQVVGRVYKVGSYWFAHSAWDALKEQAIRLVRDYHTSYPLRSGLSKEEWRARLHLSPRLAAEVFNELQVEGQLVSVAEGERQTSSTAGGLIRLSSFALTFTREQQHLIEQLIKTFQANPFMPPGRAEAEALVGAEVLNALMEQGSVVRLGGNVLFLRETYQEAIARVVAFMQENGKITVAEARDITGATRKYILPLLEHMDALHITRRIGDERVPGRSEKLK
ncbi:MAG TPA: selenocysteine-specific translation elongation factor [Ktedonobacteraceae bacterium]|jgi:selenocysteine-specific elongation factor